MPTNTIDIEKELFFEAATGNSEKYFKTLEKIPKDDLQRVLHETFAIISIEHKNDSPKILKKITNKIEDPNLLVSCTRNCFKTRKLNKEFASESSLFYELISKLRKDEHLKKNKFEVDLTKQKAMEIISKTSNNILQFLKIVIPKLDIEKLDKESDKEIIEFANRHLGINILLPDQPNNTSVKITEEFIPKKEIPISPIINKDHAPLFCPKKLSELNTDTENNISNPTAILNIPDDDKIKREFTNTTHSNALFSCIFHDIFNNFNKTNSQKQQIYLTKHSFNHQKTWEFSIQTSGTQIQKNSDFKLIRLGNDEFMLLKMINSNTMNMGTYSIEKIPQTIIEHLFK